MKKIIVLIAGLGNIGYRHLQSILNVNYYIDLYLIDKSLNNLSNIKNKLIKLDKKKKIKSLNINNKPIIINKRIDVAIISTNSDVRYSLLKKIIKTNKVKYLILEKFLFQSIYHYQSVRSLVKKTKVFVHCPLRNYPSFKYVKKICIKKKIIKMYVYQKDLGICCNSIHYLDLFSYLTNSNSFTLVKNDLKNKIYLSKRKNFIEFKGNLLIKNSKDSYLSINDNYNCGDNITIILEFKNSKIQFEFLYKNKIIIVKKNDIIIKKFSLPYTSETTEMYVKNLLANGKCDLPNYTISSKQHIFLLSLFLDHYSNIKKKKFNACPIS